MQPSTGGAGGGGGGGGGGSFVPDAELFGQVLHMLSCALIPDSAVQKQVFDALSLHSKNPEFLLYLSLIFSEYQASSVDMSVLPSLQSATSSSSSTSPDTATISLNIRHTAGVTLKGAIETSWTKCDPAVQSQVASTVLLVLSTAEESLIRSTAANTLTAIVRRAGGVVSALPELPGHLVSMLDPSATPSSQAGALSALELLAEDTAQEWTLEDMANVAPRLIDFMRNPKEEYRLKAARAMHEFAKQAGGYSFTSAIWTPYLTTLCSLAEGDESKAMREVLLLSFADTVSDYWSECSAYISNMVNLAMSGIHPDEDDDNVAKAACDFWTALLSALGAADRTLNETNRSTAKANREQLPTDWVRPHLDELIPLLHSIIPALLARCVWTEDGLADLDPWILDENAVSTESDIRPRASGSRSGAGSGRSSSNSAEDQPTEADFGRVTNEEEEELEGEEDDDDDDDGGGYYGGTQEVKAYELRAQAATALQAFSHNYHGLILESLMPEIEARMNAPSSATSTSSIATSNDNDESWKQREVGMFAFGLIADGCLDELDPYMATIYASMLHLSKDPHPLVRAVTIWSLGTFSNWIFEKYADPARPEAEHDQGGAGAGGMSGEEYVSSFVKVLCEGVVDKNQRVQQYSLVALYMAINVFGDTLLSYGPLLVQALSIGLAGSMSVTRPFFYDTIGVALTRQVFSFQDMQDASYPTGPLFHQLFNQFTTLRVDCLEFGTITELLAEIIEVAQADIAPLCVQIYLRCMQGLRNDLVDGIGSFHANEAQHQCNVACACMDVIAAMIEYVGDATADLVLAPSLSALAIGAGVSITGSSISTASSSSSLSSNGVAGAASVVGAGAGGVGGEGADKNILFEMLTEGLVLPVSDVHQSTYGLLGNACRHPAMWPVISPHAGDLVSHMLGTLNAFLHEHRFKVSAANNATWALGIMAPQVGGAMSQVVPYALPMLYEVLKSKNINVILYQNCSHALGMLALHAPNDLVVVDASGSANAGVVWPGWVQPWVASIPKLKDITERSYAAMGLCACITTSPIADPGYITRLAMGFSSWFEPQPSDPQVIAAVHSAMAACKASLDANAGAGNFQALFNSWKPALQQKMANVFGIIG